jgi:2-polyprenyl-6-methoxyphenol hydroxylase-like FAD-dependent oxidoreductase
MKALIVGAGLGGLSAGLALRQAGAEVSMFERAGSLEAIQVGIGMVLWPNGTRALDRLGVAEDVTRAGAPLESLDLYAASGKLLNRWNVGEINRATGAPSLALSRSDLHGVLARAFQSDSAIAFGSEAVDFAEDADGVTIDLSDGRSERGDVLVGADGSASGTRRKVAGKGPPDFPPYAGYTIWHSIVPFDVDAVPARVFFLLFGRGGRFAYYRLDDERVYWSGIGFVPSGHETDIRKREVLDFFRGYAPPVTDLIEVTDESRIHRHDIYGGETLDSWGAGRVTLLGDAAHPMTTNLGQGAGMAIEDGVVLAHCLGESSDPVAGLREYESRRMGRTATMMDLANRLNSNAALEGRVRTWVRNQMISHLFERGIGRDYEKFIRSDALA